MTKFINTFIFAVFAASAAMLFAVPAYTFAQYYDYDYGTSYDYGSSYSYDYGSSYDYDYGSSNSYDYSDSYSYDYGTTYDYDYGSDYTYDYGTTYDYDNGTSYDYDYGSDYVYDYGSSYDYDYGTSYDYDYGSDYSYDYGTTYDYDYGSNYSYDYGTSYDYDYGDAYDYDYGSSYGYDYGDSYTYDYGTAYDYDYGANYSYDYGDAYGYDYGTTYDYYDYDYVDVYDDSSYTYDYRNYLQGNTYTYTYNQSNPTYNKPAPVRDDKDDDKENEPREAICNSFTASDYEGRAGEMVTLRWNTTGATSASISPNIGSVGVDGSYNVIINRDVTYTLTASNNNDTAKCTVSVDKIDGINDDDDDDDNDDNNSGSVSKTPRCELDASDTRIDRGDKITLSWETTDATRVRLVDSRGDELLDTNDFDSDERDDFYDGRLSVRPTRDTTYTLTAERGSKERECEVEIEVERVVDGKEENDDEDYVIYDYQPKQVNGIYLKQVPYTGLDSGSMVTYSFYGLLGLWALYAAYYLAIRRPKLKTQKISTTIN